MSGEAELCERLRSARLDFSARLLPYFTPFLRPCLILSALAAINLPQATSMRSTWWERNSECRYTGLIRIRSLSPTTANSTPLAKQVEADLNPPHYIWTPPMGIHRLVKISIGQNVESRPTRRSRHSPNIQSMAGCLPNKSVTIKDKRWHHRIRQVVNSPSPLRPRSPPMELLMTSITNCDVSAK